MPNFIEHFGNIKGRAFYSRTAIKDLFYLYVFLIEVD